MSLPAAVAVRGAAPARLRFAMTPTIARRLRVRVIAAHSTRQFLRDRAPHLRIFFRESLEPRALDVRNYHVRDCHHRCGAGTVRVEHRHFSNRRPGTAGGNPLAINLDRNLTFDDEVDILVGRVLFEQSLPTREFFDRGLIGELSRQPTMVADYVM